MSERTKVVVVGVDGSADSTAAVKWADNYASLTGARLRLVTTWVWPTTYGVVYALANFTPDADGHDILDKARAELTVPESRVETICREGGAGPVLVAESEDATMLVVGSHGHGAIGSILIGSVSNYCVHHATCPVVVVR